MFPDGLHDMSWSFDISSSPLPAGHVTGDYAIMAAVAQSLVRRKAADALDMADAMAASYDMTQPEQWYSPYSKLMLEGLAAGRQHCRGPGAQ
jgi:ADP-ribosylglycohydrolase